MSDQAPPESDRSQPPNRYLAVALAAWRLIVSYWVFLSIMAIALITTAFKAPNFFTVNNLINIARQSSILGVVAVGMTLVILTKGIDLTVGALLAVASSTFVVLIIHGVPLFVAFPATLAVGALAGLWNGAGVSMLGVPPFVMTLAGFVIFRGVAFRIAQGTPRRYDLESGFLDFFGGGMVGRIPGPVIVFVITTIVAWAALRYLPFGPHVRAVGGNIQAARRAGVRVRGILLLVYALSGVCAALAGIMTAARLGIGDPTAGQLMELDAIAAVVIGGTSLFGGVGSMWGTMAGALLLGTVSNVLNLAGVSPFEQMMVRGLLILVAVLAQQRGVTSIYRRRETAAQPAVPKED